MAPVKTIKHWINRIAWDRQLRWPSRTQLPLPCELLNIEAYRHTRPACQWVIVNTPDVVSLHFVPGPNDSCTIPQRYVTSLQSSALSPLPWKLVNRNVEERLYLECKFVFCVCTLGECIGGVLNRNLGRVRFSCLLYLHWESLNLRKTMPWWNNNKKSEVECTWKMPDSSRHWCKTRGVYSTRIWVGGFGRLNETLTLFKTKDVNFATLSKRKCCSNFLPCSRLD